MTELKFIEVPAPPLDRPPCDEDEQLRRSREGGGNRDVWACFARARELNCSVRVGALKTIGSNASYLCNGFRPVRAGLNFMTPQVIL